MLIVFEGVDGSGKSTQIKLLNKYLLSQSCEVVLTREPGGSPMAEKLRNIFLYNEFNNEEQLALIAAARALNILEVILPALKDNKIVLSDRYSASTKIYQNETCDFGIKPDICFILDLPSDIALNRIKKRNTMDAIEKDINLDIIEHRRQGYLAIARQEPNCIIIDATNPQNEIHNKIRDIVCARI